MREFLVLFAGLVVGQNKMQRNIWDAVYQRSPLGYTGNGEGTPQDYVKYFIRETTPSLLKLVARAHERYPPQKTDLRFRHAGLDAVLANFNNSLASGCPQRLLERGICYKKSTFSDLQLFEDSGSMAALVANNRQKKLVVSYRFSITTQNWLDDFNADQIDLPGAPEGVRIHRGVYTTYLASYTRVRQAARAMLSDPRFKEYSLLVSGYSLGGAICQVAMPDFLQLVNESPYPRPVEVIAYAAPRVGNRAFAEYMASFDVPLTRITFTNDVVSHLPLRAMNFTHAGQEIHVVQPEITDNYTLRMCSQEYDEDPKCAWAENDHVDLARHFLPFGTGFPIMPLG